MEDRWKLWLAVGEEAKKRDKFLVSQAMENWRLLQAIMQLRRLHKDRRALEITAKD